MNPSSDSDPSDHELLLKVRHRAPAWLDAFGELIRRHEGWVRGLLRSRLADWSAADDLAQDVFVTSFHKIHTFRGDARFEDWLRGIALNHLRNYLRKRREHSVGHHPELERLLDQEASGFASSAPGQARLDALKSCLSSLDVSSRELLVSRYVHGFSVREISSSSGKGYSALTMRLHRLRTLLADCIGRRLQQQES